MPTGTVKLHRVLRAAPDRVYRAFIDADAMAKWLPPDGFTGKVHHLDPKKGGTYRMSFTNFTTGKSHSFHGEFIELVPNERLVYTDKFDDPGLEGEMRTTVNGDRHRAGGHSRRDPGRCLLSRVGGLAHSPCQARRARNS
jgi:uncharacterized protein YndB with AHSA1/START domain